MKTLSEDKGATIHRLRRCVAFISALRAAFGGCAPKRSPAGACAESPCWEPMISAACSKHPEEAALPLRWRKASYPFADSPFENNYQVNIPPLTVSEK